MTSVADSLCHPSFFRCKDNMRNLIINQSVSAHSKQLYYSVNIGATDSTVVFSGKNALHVLKAH